MKWTKASEKLPWHRAHWKTGKLGPDDNSFPVRMKGYYSMGDIFNQAHEGEPEIPMFYIRGKGDIYSDQFYLIEWLDETDPPLPASIEDEAKAIAEKRFGSIVADTVSIEVCIEYYKEAHITCARMYTGEIAALKAELSKMWMNYIVPLYRQQGVTEETIKVNWQEYKAKHNL